jgi:hypothetical protein
VKFVLYLLSLLGRQSLQRFLEALRRAASRCTLLFKKGWAFSWEPFVVITRHVRSSFPISQQARWTHRLQHTGIELHIDRFRSSDRLRLRWVLTFTEAYPDLETHSRSMRAILRRLWSYWQRTYSTSGSADRFGAPLSLCTSCDRTS